MQRISFKHNILKEVVKISLKLNQAQIRKNKIKIRKHLNRCHHLPDKQKPNQLRNQKNQVQKLEFLSKNLHKIKWAPYWTISIVANKRKIANLQEKNQLLTKNNLRLLGLLSKQQKVKLEFLPNLKKQENPKSITTSLNIIMID